MSEDDYIDYIIPLCDACGFLYNSDPLAIIVIWMALIQFKNDTIQTIKLTNI
jgi:hypothetical protein